jgi:hypothetical protein
LMGHNDAQAQDSVKTTRSAEGAIGGNGPRKNEAE